MSKFDRDLRAYFSPRAFSTAGVAGTGSMTATGEVIQFYKYIHIGHMVWFSFYITNITTGGTASSGLEVDAPKAPNQSNEILHAELRDAASGAIVPGHAFTNASNGTIDVYKSDNSNWGLGTGRLVLASGWYVTNEIG